MLLNPAQAVWFLAKTKTVDTAFDTTLTVEIEDEKRRQKPYYCSYFFSTLLCIPVKANTKTPFSIVFQQYFLPRDKCQTRGCST